MAHQSVSTSFLFFCVFQYLSFRSIVSLLTAFFIALLISPSLIRQLTLHQIGQTIRTLGPESHFQKRYAHHGRGFNFISDYYQRTALV